MSYAPFVLSDRLVTGGFRLLREGRRLFQGFDVSVDRDGNPWAFKTTNYGCVGLGLAPNWLFDHYAVLQRVDAAATERQRIHQLAAGEHRDALNQVLRGRQLGPRTERLAFTIHRAVMRARSSLLTIPDLDLAAVAWGPGRVAWPRHWRQELFTSLKALTWLHIAPGKDQPDFGTSTALLTHVGDLRGKPGDTCDTECPLLGGPSHHHIRINVGRGFLGILESCADPDDDTGVRSYLFPITAKSKSTVTLSRLGKSGRLTSLYLPAVIGNRDACERLSRDQHRLLQAVVRETTRATKADRKEIGKAEIITGSNLPVLNSRAMTSCCALDATCEYVGFNGNGKRKRLGYRLNTTGGWLAKAGYAVDDLERFLSDMEQLSQVLGLIVVGLLPSDRSWRSLEQMRAMIGTRSGRATLERLHLRVYTAADYVERWNRTFSWPFETVAPVEDQRHDDIHYEVQRRARRRGFRRELAVGLDFDPSLLGKVIAGKKSWPAGWLDRVAEWLAAHPDQRKRPVVATCPALPLPTSSEHHFGVVAQDFLRRGFSVVPQLAGRKWPCVRWKAYQERLPTEQEVAAWSQRWPQAGLALVLGPVSNAFVLDVDGGEAHQSLLDHLGTEPLAPKVLSGSRLAHRYHLFFKNPAITTKAKATPWHRKLEFRGKGAVVILPPSLHPSGHPYVWAPGQSLDDLPLPELPAQILAALARRAVPLINPATVVAVNGINASQSTIEVLSGQYANGPNWNTRLFTAACDLAGREVPLDEAEHMLLAGAQPWDEPQREAAIRTIRSAYQQRRVPARV